MKNTKQCATCSWWEPPTAEATFKFGACRLWPPTWRRSSVKPEVWFSAFPETSPAEWCSLWAKKSRPSVKRSRAK